MVYHAREISLIKETATEQGLVKYKDNEESLALELKYLHKPKLTSALHGSVFIMLLSLHVINSELFYRLHMTYPSLGPASCLAKRWVSSHLLLDDSLMPEMCVELLMASIYLTPEPFQTPIQPQTAFLRFLQLLVKAPWKFSTVAIFQDPK
jgi:U3 small nucleolar RNA-associated protein 22